MAALCKSRIVGSAAADIAGSRGRCCKRHTEHAHAKRVSSGAPKGTQLGGSDEAAIEDSSGGSKPRNTAHAHAELTSDPVLTSFHRGRAEADIDERRVESKNRREANAHGIAAILRESNALQTARMLGSAAAAVA